MGGWRDLVNVSTRILEINSLGATGISCIAYTAKRYEKVSIHILGNFNNSATGNLEVLNLASPDGVYYDNSANASFAATLYVTSGVGAVYQAKNTTLAEIIAPYNLLHITNKDANYAVSSLFVWLTRLNG